MVILLILLLVFMFLQIFHLLKVNNDKSLTELEVSRVRAIVNILKDTSHYHSTNFADMDIALLLKVLHAWPPAMMFPGWSSLVNQLVKQNCLLHIELLMVAICFSIL